MMIITLPTHTTDINLHARITDHADASRTAFPPDLATLGSPLQVYTLRRSKWIFTTTHCSHRKDLAVNKNSILLLLLHLTVSIGVAGRHIERFGR